MLESKTALSEMLERLSRVMRSAEHETGLNPAQWEALRYLNRANRFSNYPGALAKYLGATKGTVSQTLMALERKGLVEKKARPGERRSIALRLTRKGRMQLEQDPWRQLADDLEFLETGSARRLAGGLAELLQAALRRSGRLTFGQCRTCRYFGRAGSRGPAPHRCLLLELPLKESDSLRICVEHEPR
jgi:DNA-binding MarR family transcriptional regulator